jgi:hypothetical protein
VTDPDKKGAVLAVAVDLGHMKVQQCDNCGESYCGDEGAALGYVDSSPCVFITCGACRWHPLIHALVPAAKGPCVRQALLKGTERKTSLLNLQLLGSLRFDRFRCLLKFFTCTSHCQVR